MPLLDLPDQIILAILAVHPEACFDCTGLDRRLRLAAAAALAGQRPWAGAWRHFQSQMPHSDGASHAPPICAYACFRRPRTSHINPSPPHSLCPTPPPPPPPPPPGASPHIASISSRLLPLVSGTIALMVASAPTPTAANTK